MSEVFKGDIQTPKGTQEGSGIVFGDWSREEKLKKNRLKYNMGAIIYIKTENISVLGTPSSTKSLQSTSLA